jgi:prevent-host-death family protein
MPARIMSATEFKAKCLGLLDEVQERGETITITKRGRPVAVLGPPRRRVWKSPADSWAGRAEILGDIVNGDPDLWDCVRESEEED